MKYVSSLEKLNELIALGSKEPILVGGALVLVSNSLADLQDASASERYILQQPRTASRKSLFDKNKKYLYVAVERKAVQMLAEYQGEVMLSIDQYLAYGLLKSVSRDVIVLGGGPVNDRLDTDAFTIEATVFTNQQLEAIYERNVSNKHDLDIHLKDMLDKYPEHTVYWCDPLPELQENHPLRDRKYVEAGSEPLQSQIKRKIFTRNMGESADWGVIPALAIVLVGVGLFAGAYAYKNSAFEAERSEFLSVIGGYEDEYAQSSRSLELLRHRNFELSTESDSSARVRLLNALVAHSASIPDVTVERVAVYRDDGSDRWIEAGAEDFLVELSVPKRIAARLQSRDIIERLSAVSGYTVQVIEHREVSHEDVPHWAYRIGGSKRDEQ